MRLTGDMLRRLIAEELERCLVESRFLFEEDKEEEEDSDSSGSESDAPEVSDDAAASLFGDDEGEEESKDSGASGASPSGSSAPGGKSDATSSAAEGESTSDDEEERDSEEEEELKKSPKPTGPSGFEFDEEINAAMAGFEEKALDIASAKSEGRTLTLARFLFEAEGDDEVAIDIASFADDTARLISNYDTLIDMEQAIYTKAVDFVSSKYGEAAAEQLRDILSMRYDIDLQQQNDPEADEIEIYAAGATGGAGGAS